MEPPTTRNSTSVSGPRPNWSRMSFGIVTCPRSTILILKSMRIGFLSRQGLAAPSARAERLQFRRARDPRGPQESRVFIRKIRAVMGAPALFAPQRGGGDHRRHLMHIAQFDSRQRRQTGWSPFRAFQLPERALQTF